MINRTTKWVLRSPAQDDASPYDDRANIGNCVTIQSTPYFSGGVFQIEAVDNENRLTLRRLSFVPKTATDEP